MGQKLFFIGLRSIFDFFSEKSGTRFLGCAYGQLDLNSDQKKNKNI